MTVPSKMLRRNTSAANVAFMTEALQQVEWEVLSNTNDVDVAVDELNRIIRDTLDKFAPYKEIVVRRPHARWMNEEIKANVRMRNSLRMKYNRMRDVSILSRYKHMRNIVKRQMYTAKSNYCMSRIAQLGNSREVWKELRSLGVLPISHSQVASNFSPERLNHYFTSVFTSSEIPLPLQFSQGLFDDTKFYSRILPRRS